VSAVRLTAAVAPLAAGYSAIVFSSAIQAKVLSNGKPKPYTGRIDL
jgi:hypothetical protein